MIDARDMEHCREAIRQGSHSFHAASKLLPGRMRDPALALYAFCRLADDCVDRDPEPGGAVARLRTRLDLACDGRPRNAPADRAFAAVIEAYEMPRALPEALLEGLAWDEAGRRYETLSQLHDYAARVAASVGAMMCVLMGARDAATLARACDLGVAMQLTNIARDVGEDARARRIYLPIAWMEEAGLDPEAFLAEPLPFDAVRAMVRRLLEHADRLYLRAEAGIPALPLAARPGIFAARHIYAGIGTAIRRNGCDSVSWRGRTSRRQKVGWLGLSAIRAAASAAMPRSAVLYAQPLPETAFLVAAAARSRPATGQWGEGRAGDLVAVFAQLKAHDSAREGQAGTA